MRTIGDNEARKAAVFFYALACLTGSIIILGLLQ